MGTGGSQYRASAAEAEIGRLSLKAGRAYEKAGDTERAISIYESGGQIVPAAALAEQAGEHRRVAQLYRKAGNIQKAAELFQKVGEHQAAANLLGDQQLSKGDARAAAESFLEAGDVLRAAEVLDEAGELTRASECYEKGGAFPQAAETALRAGVRDRAARMFARAGEKQKAAELFHEAGEFEEAARLFGEANRFFDAAKAAAEANNEHKMMEYLQRVPPSDERFFLAVVELARGFERRGWSSLAVEKLKTVLAGQSVTAENLPLWDAYATAVESEGDLDRAAEILHGMMAVQYNYGNIAARHAALQMKITEQTKRAETMRAAVSTPVTADGRARYEVKSMLGRGGMGAVYRAYDHLLKRHVAYKVLSEELAKDANARQQLLDEARSAAALNHPNIVTVYDVVEEGNKAFICMELVEGENYQSLLCKRSPMEVQQALHWMVSVCQGLDHAHQRGIVHRDLKPSNTLLTTDNRVKILDFGLAQPHNNGHANDPGWSTSISGTPKYISPEAIRGQPTDPRTDIYSLGATLYELLAGRPPFADGNLLMHHLHTAPPLLQSQRSEISKALEELVMLCLAKTPADRFQTAGEVLSFATAARLL